jgi:hypothetical protein
MVDCGTLTCPEFVKAYPTWALVGQGQVFDVREGYQSVDGLKDMSR